MKITENHIDEATTFFSSSQGILQIGEQTYSEPICWQDGKVSIIPQITIEELNEQIFISAIETAENRPEVIIIGTGAKQQFLHPKNCSSIISLRNRLRMHEHSLSLPNFSFTARRRPKHMGLVMAIICRQGFYIIPA